MAPDDGWWEEKALTDQRAEYQVHRGGRQCHLRMQNAGKDQTWLRDEKR